MHILSRTHYSIHNANPHSSFSPRTSPAAGDGIFDRIESHESVQTMWTYINSNKAAEPNIHKLCAGSVEALMRQAILRKTLDNITVVMIGLQNLDRVLSEPKSNDTSYEQASRNTPYRKINDSSQSLMNQMGPQLNQSQNSKSQLAVSSRQQSERKNSSSNPRPAVVLANPFLRNPFHLELRQRISQPSVGYQHEGNSGTVSTLNNNSQSNVNGSNNRVFDSPQTERLKSRRIQNEI